MSFGTWPDDRLAVGTGRAHDCDENGLVDAVVDLDGIHSLADQELDGVYRAFSRVGDDTDGGALGDGPSRIAPAKNSLGRGRSCVARLSPINRSAVRFPPRSRTVVTPFTTYSSSGTFATVETCTCMSIKPGTTQCPFACTT